MAKKVYEEKNIAAIADKIREKTGGGSTYKTSEMPEGIEKVYEAGQKSMIDESKIIEKKVSRKGSVLLTDVSEVPHNITARVGGSNTVVVDGITYTAAGEGTPSKNLLKYPYIQGSMTAYGATFTDLGDGGIEISGAPTIQCGYVLQTDIPLEDGKTYKLTNNSENVGYNNGVLFVMSYKDETNTVKYCSTSLTWKKEYTFSQVYIQIYRDTYSGAPVKIYPMLQEGTDTIEYEPYTTWYEIENIKSNSPNMSFIGGDYLEVNHNKSWGMQAEYDRFWNNYKLSSSDATCKFAGVGWNNETFRPNANLSYSNCYMLFRMSRIEGDLVEILNNLGITLSTANAGTLIYAFSYTHFTRIGEIDTRKCATLTSVFENSTKLKIIDKIILKDDGSNTFSNAFSGCTSLEDITVEGVIGNNIDFKDCPLSHASLMSIINSLKRFRATCNYTFETGPFDNQVLNYGKVYDITSMVDNGICVDASSDGYGDIFVQIYDEGFSSADYSGAVKVKFNSEGSFTLYFVDDTSITRTLTLGSTNLAKLTDEEKKKATDKGWILA